MTKPARAGLPRQSSMRSIAALDNFRNCSSVKRSREWGQYGIKNTRGEVPFPEGELLKNRQLGLGGLRFFSTSVSVIIIIIGSTGHS